MWFHWFEKNFVKIWTNFGNLIENFNKNLEKFNEKLKFFLLTTLIFSDLKNLCSGGDVPPVPPGAATVCYSRNLGGQEAW